MMKKITESDARVSYFFNAIERITLLLEDLLASQKPLLNGERYISIGTLKSTSAYIK